VAPFSVIGPRCTIGTDAVVSGAVLWPESTIGVGASVDRAIIGRGVQIGDHATVGPDTVVGDQSQITSYSRLR
jgi:NDP-sugar pyrophosphorylase family protein